MFRARAAGVAPEVTDSVAVISGRKVAEVVVAVVVVEWVGALAVVVVVVMVVAAATVAAATGVVVVAMEAVVETTALGVVRMVVVGRTINKGVVAGKTPVTSECTFMCTIVGFEVDRSWVTRGESDFGLVPGSAWDACAGAKHTKMMNEVRRRIGRTKRSKHLHKCACAHLPVFHRLRSDRCSRIPI